MGRKANIDSIRVLDEQILKLKRTRNSLLNISTRVPPEILGRIFVLSLARKPSSLYNKPFKGFRKGSYNFLLVCHHWFEVAFRTPELWSFWGNTLQDWKKRHHRSGTFPLDLVLDGDQCDPDVHFDDPLYNAVRGRVIQNTIRKVHLRADNNDALVSIISSLTPDDEGSWNENIESIIWQNEEVPPVDVSDFFTRSHLSKLSILSLSGFWILPWNYLASRTTLLTTLSLQIGELPESPTPTTSQLFSILASNPNLRRLFLSNAILPNDTDGSTSKMPLPNLKLLSLAGEFRRVSMFLHRLVLPATLDNMNLTVFQPTIEEISQTLGPYMRDHYRRDVRFQDGLAVSSFIAFSSVVTTVDTTSILPTIPASVTITVILAIPHVEEQLLINLITPIPRENVVSFIPHSVKKLPEEAFYMMPNIKMLHLFKAELSEGFLQPNPDGPRANTKLLPSLQSLCLEDVTLGNDDWGYLTTYLVHQTSNGQGISLDIAGDPPRMDMAVENEIQGLVGEFTLPPQVIPTNGYLSSCDH